MIPLRRTILLRAFKLFDLMIMAFSFVIACEAVYYKSGMSFIERFFTVYISAYSIVFFICLFCLWHLSFSYFGLYVSRRLSYQGGEIIDVVKATFAGTLAILLSVQVFGMRPAEPLFIFVFWSGCTAICILWRLVLRFILKHIRLKGRNLRHILILGSNEKAVRFAQNIKKNSWLGYILVGFMDNRWSGTEKFEQDNYRIITGLENVPLFIKTNKIDEVVISLPIQSFSETLYDIIALCEENGIIMRFLYDISGIKIGKGLVEYFEGDKVTMLYSGPLEGWQVLLKHIFDFSLALVLIVLLSPVFLITMILIKLTSEGPVFFVQKRLGIYTRRFSLYKFRTMVPDAEKIQGEIEHLNEVSGPVFKIKNDPRVTTTGKILRKMSIDELPQLINVLKGDMSLVGPRPITERDYDGFDKYWYRRRFGVRPGMTCLWQIYGRSAIPFDNWMKLDLQYIDNWSLWLDLKILAKTIPAVFRGSGAA